LSTRKFYIICIVTLIAVVALAMLMVAVIPEGTAAPAPVQDAGAGDYAVFPLGLGLTLALLADMGLMTAGLVILFKDERPSGQRFR